MTIEHSFKASNGVHIYIRKYIGDGRYFQKGIARGIDVGDKVTSFTSPQSVLTVDEVLSKQNSKGKFIDPEHGINSLYEAELVDSAYNPSLAYTPLCPIGFLR